MSALRRPALRYHGGKWRLAPWIIAQFPAHRVYVEPFGGGASVLLRKPRAYAEIYNDLDDEIVNVFSVLRNEQASQRLREALRLTPFARTEFRRAYERSEDPVEQARRTLIRSLIGYGSDAVNGNHKTGFRSNSNRSHTTPAHDWRNYPPLLEAFTERLAGVVIEHRDALDVIAQHDSEGTLFYVDPPYVHATRSTAHNSSKRNYRHEMSDDDHRSLAAALHGVRGMVIVSGYESPLYEEVFSDWTRTRRTAYADGARRRREVLWMNAPVLTSSRQMEISA